MTRLVTITEIAQLLGCCTKTVRRKVDKRLIPAIQPDGPGTLLRFDLDDVLHAVKKTEPDSAFDQATREQAETRTQSAQSTSKLPGPVPLWKRQPKSKQKGKNA